MALDIDFTQPKSGGLTINLGDTKEIAKTMNSITGNPELLKYWKDLKTLIDMANASLENFAAAETRTNADELVKSFNALKAISGSSLEELGFNVENVTSSLAKAKNVASEFAKSWDSARFSDFFTTLESLKSEGMDAEEVLSRLGASADVEQLRNKIEQLNSSIATLKADKEALSKTATNLGVEDLNSEIERLNEIISKTISQTQLELESFFRANDIDIFDQRVQKVIESISEYDKRITTTKEAIADFKNQYSEMFTSEKSIDSEGIQTLLTRINELHDAVKSISDNGVSVRGGSLFDVSGLSELGSSEAKSGIDSVKEMLNAAGSGDGVSNLIRMFTAMNSAKDMRIEPSTVKTLAQLVDTVSAVDVSKINAFSAAFVNNPFKNLAEALKSIPDTSKLKSAIDSIDAINSSKLKKLSEVKFNNLAKLSVDASSLQSLAKNIKSIVDGINGISADKVKKISELDFSKISKLAIDNSSMQSLAKYLPAISSIDVNGLKALANIDFSNLSKLNVNKSALGGLAALAAESSSIKNLADMLNSALQALNISVDSGSEDGDGVEKIKTLKEGAVAYDNALRKCAEAITQCDTKLKNYTASMNDPQSREAYNDIINVKDGWVSLRDAIQDESVTTTEFQSAQASLNRTFKESIEVITSYEKNMTKNKDVTQPLIKDTSQYNQALEKCSNVMTKAGKASNDWTAAMNDPRTANAYNDLKQIYQEAEKLRDGVNDGTITQEEYNIKIGDLSTRLTAASSTIVRFGLNFASLGQKVSRVGMIFTRYFTSYRIFTTLISKTKEMFNSAKNIESSMAQLQIVTGATDSQMKSFLSSSISLAKELGQSITDVMDSIETFSRLGYSLDESSTLAKFATILSNVADTTAEEATTGITSIIKGFGMDVEDVSHVADVLVQVGQKYAVSASELMEAYEKSGAALSATNTTFEKSAGLIAAANAAVQNASTVGTALKTISARIRGSKSDLEDLGEDTSDLADGFSKYADEIKKLTGFDIMADATIGKFKDLYDIFDGLSSKWEGLSDTVKSRVAEILGGTRQLQIVSSIMSNWGDAVGAYTDALDSENVALNANAIAMDTIEKKQAQFNAKLEELATIFMNTDFLKELMDLGIGILNLVSDIAKLFDKMGGLKILMTYFISFVLPRLAVSFVNLTRSVATVPQMIANATSKWIQFVSAYEGGAKSVQLANEAISASSGIIGLIATVISAAIAVVGMINSSNEEAVDKIRQATQSTIDEKNSIEELTLEYDELNNKIEATSEDIDRMCEIKEELHSKYQIEIDDINTLIKKYDDYREAMKAGVNTAKNDLKSELSDYSVAKWNGGDSKFSALIDEFSKENNLNGSQLLPFASLLNWKANYQLDLSKGLDLSTLEGAEKLLERIGNLRTKLFESGMSNSEFYSSISQGYDAVAAAIKSYTDIVNESNNVVAKDIALKKIQESELPQTREEFEKFRRSILMAVNSSNDFAGSLSDAINITDEILKNDSSFASFYQEVESSISAIEDFVNKIQSASDEWNGLAESIKSATDALDDVKSLQELVADGFTVSAEEAMKLAEVYPQILSQAKAAADGQLELNESVVNGVIEGEKEKYIAEIDAKIAGLEAERAYAQAQLDIAQNQAQASRDFAQYRLDVSNELVKALIENGVSEADAYEVVTQVMSGNTEELDTVIANVATNASGNAEKASAQAATSLYNNAYYMKMDISSIAEQAHNAALAILGMGDGTQRGSSGIVSGSGGSSYTSGNTYSSVESGLSTSSAIREKIAAKTSARNFDYKFVLDLDEYILDLTNGISDLTGQIDGLNALKAYIKNIGKSSSSGTSSGSSGSGGSSSSSSESESWFEAKYKEYSHYVAMGQMSQAKFLNWLSEAYQQAFDEGIITLDEYNKYAEEVVNGVKEIVNSAKDAYEELVDYRVDMLKQDIENQKDALNDQLDDLKDFYDKQKDMLRKQKDDEEYIKEQAEKRKSVSDIKTQLAMLENDNSASAQKRKLELEDELNKANEELADFEADRAYDIAEDMLDDQYSQQESLINSAIQSLDDILNDPAGLRNKAIEDIKTSGKKLYKEFVDFNNKYGDGNAETVSSMWNEIYTALYEYKVLTGTNYNGVKMKDVNGVNPNKVTPSSKKSTATSTKTSNKSASSTAPSLTEGSYVNVKDGTLWYSVSNGSGSWGYARSGTIEYISPGSTHPYNIEGLGWIRKEDIVGYRSGTKNATAGLHEIFEDGSETLFTSSSGGTYKLMSAGDKVLNAKATNFLYDFANGGASQLASIIKKSVDSAVSGVLQATGLVNNFTTGDIIINGNATEQTVSEIRRTQRESVDYMLKSFQKLQKK